MWGLRAMAVVLSVVSVGLEVAVKVRGAARRINRIFARDAAFGGLGFDLAGWQWMLHLHDIRR